jgi:HEAT repeat protein
VQAIILVEDIEVIPLLLQLLQEDPCPQVRAITALAIGILAKSGDQQAVLSHLAEVMGTNPYDQVRAMVAGAMRLLSMGTRLIAHNPALVEVCLKALCAPHPQVVIAAIRLLEEVQSDEVDRALQQVLTHPNWWVRFGVVDVLVARGCHTEALQEAVLRLFQEYPARSSLLVLDDEGGNIIWKTVEEYLNELSALLANQEQCWVE